MQVASLTYVRLAKGIGGLITLMGLGTLGVFLAYLLTGTNALAGDLPGVGAVGLLVMASLGAFALPLGLSLFSDDPAMSSRLRLAAGALGLLAVLRLFAYAHPGLRSTLGATPLVEFIVLGAIALVAVGLRRENEPSVELRFEFPIAAPAEAAWRVLGDEFADVADWTSSLRASSLDGELAVGATRTCDVESFGPFSERRVTEQLLAFDPAARRLEYAARTGLPAPIQAASNRWSIEVVDAARCCARSHVSLELSWWALPLAPLLRWTLRSNVARVGEELRHRVEGGSPQPR